MQKIDKVIIHRNGDLIYNFVYSNNKLTFAVTDDIVQTFSESIVPVRISRINQANNSAFVEYSDTQTGYINLPKWLKVQNGSKLHAQLTWQGNNSKQAKFRATWQIAGKYIVYNSKSDKLKFTNKNLSPELLNKLNNLLSNQPATWSIRTIAINKTNIDLIINEAQEIYSIAEEINSNKEYIYNGIPNYLKIFRELNLADNIEVFTNDDNIYNELVKKQNLWVIDTISYNRNLSLPTDTLLNEKLIQLENGSTLEIGYFAGINIIDINSGSNNTDKNTTNFLILDEIYRQICIQNLQGIILVDVIKNSSILQEDKIINHLQKLFRHDISQTKILGFSNSGLLEIIRNKF